MKLQIFILLIFMTAITLGQITISGTVTDAKGLPIEGANVFIDGTYDGASTDGLGNFLFTTTEIGEQLLKVTFVGFEPYAKLMNPSVRQNLAIILRGDVNSLDTVVLSAGTFEASDNSKVSVLNSLDVVTTASALGDFVGALQTLPGTTTVAEDGRLFVRGGDAGETQIFIDGIRVFTPYTPTPNNVPTRGRYSPFLFDGITFSTGGYSAEYGEALSSVLLLNTVDEPDQNKTDITAMSVGAGLGLTRKWERSSLSVNSSYINLAPYNAIVEQRNTFQKPFETFAGESVYRYKTNNGIFKFYGAIDRTNFELTQEDINFDEGVSFGLTNTNFYTNSSYEGRIGDSWRILSGGSFTLARNKASIQSTTNIASDEKSAHLKAKLRKRFSKRFKLAFGVEHFYTDFEEDFDGMFGAFVIADTYGYQSNISAAFAETDVIFSQNFAVKLGARVSYTDYNEEVTFSPRASLAYKTGEKSQLSLAYGDFYQNPLSNVLRFTQDFKAQKTQHYILNYQYSNKGRIFRAEAFRKDYNNLVTFDTAMPLPTSVYGNDGNGFAQGIDIFFRDNTTIKNMDYWVSYSYLDSERQYLNFPEQARPIFASPHNFSVVGKYFVDDWKSQFGVSYQHSTGRTYTNPNRPGFLQENVKSFNSISLNWAYLITPQKILYASVNNVLGFNNINGFQYSKTPDMNGVFDRRSLTPAADQFFFVGFFWTISDDKTSNQLDNL